MSSWTPKSEHIFFVSPILDRYSFWRWTY